MQRDTPQPLKPDLVSLGSTGEKIEVSRNVPRGQAVHLGQHGIRIANRPEPGTVLPADLVERIHWAQLDILVKVAPNRCPQVFENRGHGDNCRPKIKTIAADRNRGSTPARPVQTVQHGYAPPLSPKTHRSGQPPEASPDHDRRVLRFHCHHILTLSGKHMTCNHCFCGGVSYFGPRNRKIRHKV